MNNRLHLALAVISVLATAVFFQNCNKSLQSSSVDLASSSSDINNENSLAGFGGSVASGKDGTLPSVVLSAPCNGGLCGASFLGLSRTNPLMSGRESQKVEFFLKAKNVLINSSEHIAVGLMSQDQPINLDGSFKPTASGGAIGIALGQLSSGSHPCPEDSKNQYAEFGIEVFGSSDPLSSVIVPGCQRISKSAIEQTDYLKISIELNCVNKVCSANSTVKNAADVVLAQVHTTGQTLRNPSPLRDVWYALTNFEPGTNVETAEFTILSESYSLLSEPVPPPPNLSPEVIYSLSSNGAPVAAVDFDAILFTRLKNVTSSGFAAAVPLGSSCPTFGPAYLIGNNTNLVPLAGVVNTYESRIELALFGLETGLDVCVSGQNTNQWQVQKSLQIRKAIDSLGQTSYFSSRPDGGDRITSISSASFFYTIVKNAFGPNFYICNEFIRASDGLRMGNCQNTNPSTDPSQWIKFDAAGLASLNHCSVNSSGSTVVCENPGGTLPAGDVIGYTFNNATGLKKRSQSFSIR